MASLTKTIFCKRIWQGIFLIYLFLVSCTSQSTQSTSAVPTCVSTNPNVNRYYTYHETMAGVVYQQYATGMLSLEAAQLLAFDYLQKIVKRWSAYSDIIITDGIGARITVTYLSPDLIQYAVLNHILYHNHAVNDFKQEVQRELAQLGQRNEMIFFMLIEAMPNTNQLDNNHQIIIDIPIQQMALTNSSNLSVYPTHGDHVLDETILVTNNPVSGYLAYPFSVIQNEQCIWVMDELYNNTVTLDVPFLTVNGEQLGRQFWSIPYEPLVKLTTVDSTPESMPTTSPYDSIITPISVINEQDYWQKISRYIWHHIILEDYP